VIKKTKTSNWAWKRHYIIICWNWKGYLWS